MLRQKNNDKDGLPPLRIRENSRLMPSHDSRVDWDCDERHGAKAFLRGFYSMYYDFRNFYLDDDLTPSDDDDDDDEDYNNHAYLATMGIIKPHPQIKELTDEEAELMAEDERRKEKNKHKKMRKKEKKRLNKENAHGDILPEEEQVKSDSGNQEKDIPNAIENVTIKNDAEANTSTEEGDATAECDKSSGYNEETYFMKIKKKEEENKALDFNNSDTCAAKCVSEATCNQEPAEESQKDQSKPLEVKRLTEEEPKDVENLRIPKKDEPRPAEEKTMGSTAEMYAQQSREMAASGNRMAAAGMLAEAVQCFTEAIKFNPTEFRLFGNRSLCYERLQQYEKALRDADLALTMKPDWIKGLFRKGKALHGLKRYYDASLVYRKVLELESESDVAAKELKCAETLHLMEMGFTWAQSTTALKSHSTLEEAANSLLLDNCIGGTQGQPTVQEEKLQESQWLLVQTRTQQVKDSDPVDRIRSKSQSPPCHPQNLERAETFSIWVGSVASTVTYKDLHEVFSRVGAVHSIKMMLEQNCAFINYRTKESCDRAIRSFNGMAVNGSPLILRYPSKKTFGGGHEPHPRAGWNNKECFFWRNLGCTRQDCTYRHVPENKHVDRVSPGDRKALKV